MTATTSFLVLIGVIAANQIVLRIAGLRARAAVFWGLQAINLALICYIFSMGLPGFEAAPLISWAIGLLFVLRVIQNNGLRSRFLREDAKRHREGQRAQVNEMVERFSDAEE